MQYLACVRSLWFNPHSSLLACAGALSLQKQLFVGVCFCKLSGCKRHLWKAGFSFLLTNWRQICLRSGQSYDICLFCVKTLHWVCMQRYTKEKNCNSGQSDFKQNNWEALFLKNNPPWNKQPHLTVSFSVYSHASPFQSPLSCAPCTTAVSGWSHPC